MHIKASFVEFFDDPDFAALRKVWERTTLQMLLNTHMGWKGMAANLGLDAVYQPLSKLVEILRQGSMEGAMDAYKQVCDACKSGNSPAIVEWGNKLNTKKRYL